MLCFSYNYYVKHTEKLFAIDLKFTFTWDSWRI